MLNSWLIVALIGVSAGVASGLFGVGGGLVIVPLLTMVTKLDIHHAIGTSLAIIVPTAAVAAFRHHASGNVEWRYVFIVALFAMIGSLLGAQLATILSSPVLKKVFAVFLVIVAIRMLLTR